jgi:hypothetical protein
MLQKARARLCVEIGVVTDCSTSTKRVVRAANPTQPLHQASPWGLGKPETASSIAAAHAGRIMMCRIDEGGRVGGWVDGWVDAQTV